MPKRIQLSRKRGWRMPPNTVKVDRTTHFGNPYRRGMFRDYTAANAVEDFKLLVMGKRLINDQKWLQKWGGNFKGATNFRRAVRSLLRGKDLACWCKPGEPCHADVLLEIANAD